MDLLTKIVANIMLLIFDALCVFIIDCIISGLSIVIGTPFWTSMSNYLPALSIVAAVLLIFQSVIVWRG